MKDKKEELNLEDLGKVEDELFPLTEEEEKFLKEFVAEDFMSAENGAFEDIEEFECDDEDCFCFLDDECDCEEPFCEVGFGCECPFCLEFESLGEDDDKTLLKGVLIGSAITVGIGALAYLLKNKDK